MKYVKAILIFVFAVAFIGAASLVRPTVTSSLGKKRSDKKKSGNAKKKDIKLQFGYDNLIPTVDIALPVSGTVSETVSAPGSLSPGSDVSVGADFSGTVLGLYVDSGDSVKEGDPIFKLDPTEKADLVTEATISLATKKLAFERAKTEFEDAKFKLTDRLEKKIPPSVKEAKLTLLKSEISLKQNQARLQNAVTKEKRARTLLKKGLGTQVEVESAASEVRVAKLTLEISNKDLQLAKDTLKLREEEAVTELIELKRVKKNNENAVNQSKRDIELAKLKLDQAKRDLKKCTIYSPITGLVTMRNINSGEAVNRNDASTTTGSHYIVSDFSRMYMYADVDEGDVTKVELKQSAKVTVNALGDEIKLNGTVADINNRAAKDGETIYFRVKILITDAPPSLRPGMTGNVEIETNRAENAVLLSMQAIGQRRRRDIKDTEILSATTGSGRDILDVVFVYEDGKAKLRVIKLGISDSDQLQVTEGLKVGEKVIGGPYRVLQNLSHDDPVKVNDAGKKSGKGATQGDGEKTKTKDSGPN